ncbi:hypothetical protein V8F06_013610 [Rhypophila decipiens]
MALLNAKAGIAKDKIPLPFLEPETAAAKYCKGLITREIHVGTMEPQSWPESKPRYTGTEKEGGDAGPRWRPGFVGDSGATSHEPRLKRKRMKPRKPSQRSLGKRDSYEARAPEDPPREPENPPWPPWPPPPLKTPMAGPRTLPTFDGAEFRNEETDPAEPPLEEEDEEDPEEPEPEPELEEPLPPDPQEDEDTDHVEPPPDDPDVPPDEPLVESEPPEEPDEPDEPEEPEELPELPEEPPPPPRPPPPPPPLRFTSSEYVSSPTMAWGGHRLPSWSWFSSKDGAIQYLPLKYAQIDWATGLDFVNPFPEFTSPSLQRQESDTEASSHSQQINVLCGLARKLFIPRFDLLVSATFDLGGEYRAEELLFVVIGRDKVERKAGVDSDGGSPKYHVLVIRPIVVAAIAHSHVWDYCCSTGGL